MQHRGRGNAHVCVGGGCPKGLLHARGGGRGLCLLKVGGKSSRKVKRGAMVDLLICVGSTGCARPYTKGAGNLGGPGSRGLQHSLGEVATCHQCRATSGQCYTVLYKGQPGVNWRGLC